MTRVPVSVLTAFALAASFALLNPVHDTDLFWQVKFGDLMLDRGGPVWTEPFYPDATDRRSIPVSPLAQIWYAVVRRIGGWELVKLLDAVLWALAFTIPALAARRKYDISRGWPAAIAIVIGALTASKFYMTRPQTFAMLGMGTFLAVILANGSLRWKVAIGAVVLVVWQNLHPSAIVGGMVSGILASIGWLFTFIQGRPKPWSEALFVLLSLAAMFATPAGTDILQVMRDNNDRVAVFRVTEWLPLFDPANQGVRTPSLIGLSLTAIMMVIRWRRIDMAWMSVAIVLAGLTVWSHRFVVFFGVAAVPVWVQAWSGLVPSPITVRFATRVHLLLMVAWLGLAYAGLRAGRLPLWNAWFPLEAIAALEREQVSGPIFTTTNWGGLLTDRGFPGWRVTHDGRYYARTHEECRWYLEAIHGDVPVEAIEQRHRPVAFFLSPEHTKLAQNLLATDRWRQSYADPFAVVIVRK
jgi:hypothetical protein